MIGRDIISDLADRNVTNARILARVAAQHTPRSSCCNAPLDGKAATMWCMACGHTIPAADIDHETYAPPIHTGDTR